ncbi:MAG: Crp/Fnr family transcriptional regulator [Bauldia sp.]
MLPPIYFSVLARMKLPVRTFPAGTTVFSEGERADHVFVVREGRVTIEHGGRVLDRLGPGDIFGEMALIDSTPRSATARAENVVEVSVLDEQTFLYLVEEMPSFALQMMRVMARRLRTMNDRAAA